MSSYTLNKNTDFWKTHHDGCNCGSFALNTTTWFSPYGIGDYTDEKRTSIIEEMMWEGYSREDIMDIILDMDVEAILEGCPWLESITLDEATAADRVVSYRLSFDEDAFECGEIDEDFHFRVRINGFWFEKCGSEPIRFCGIYKEEEIWKSSYSLVYDSDVRYFRFKQ